MALIQNSTAQNVDVQKLKRTLETLSLDGQSIKVLNITPKAPQGVDVTVKFSSGADITSATHIAAINSAITSGAQRRKIIVNDKPGYDDEVGNKDYIDDEIDAHILALIGTAPSWLDTLGEIADALKGKVSTEIETATVVTSGSTKTLAVTKYISSIVNIQDSAGNDTSLYGVTKNENIITLASGSTLSGTVTVTYTTVGEPAGDFGKYVIEWLESIDRKIDSVGLYSATVQFGTDPKAPINNLNIETFSNALEFITEPSVVVTAGSTKQIPVSDTVSTIFSITDNTGTDISLTGVTKSGSIITLPVGSTLTGNVTVKYTTPELQYGKTFVFNVPDATQTVRGVVNTGTQTIGGDKTLTGNTSIGGTLSVTGTSSISSTTITSASASSKGLVVKGVASQSANLFEVQNSAGNALVSITSPGKLVTSQNIEVAGSIRVGTSKNVLDLTSVAFGSGALESQTEDTRVNVAIGSDSSRNLTTGIGNTTVGSASGQGISTGNENTMIGETSGSGVDTGIKNTLIGASVGNSLNGEASYNTFVGYSAGCGSWYGTSNDKNCFFGYLSGSALQAGLGNVIIGGYTGSDEPTTNIGGVQRKTMNNTIVISDGVGTERLRINSLGDVGIGCQSRISQIRLDVQKHQNADTFIAVHNSNTGTAASSGILLGNSTSEYGAKIRFFGPNNTTTGFGGGNSLNIYTEIAAPVCLGTNNLARLTITASGNVAIGNSSATRSPTIKLDIQDSSNSDHFLAIHNSYQSTSGVSNNASSGLLFGSDNNQYGGQIRYNSSECSYMGGAGSFNIIQASNKPLTFSTANTIRLAITGSGNVGIGTTTPDEKLHVSGNIKASGTLSVTGHTSLTTLTAASSDATNTAAIDATVGTRHITLYPNLGSGSMNNLSQSGDQGIIFGNGTQGTGNLVIAPWANSSAGIRITSSGNVGIGTTTPDEKLHVGGNIKTENLTASGTITATTLTASANVNCLNVIATGNISATGTLSVTGASTLASVSASSLSSSGTLSVTGASTLGSVSASSVSATTLTASANVNCLNVIATGNISATGTLSVTGQSTLTGDVGIGTSSPARKLHVYGGRIIVENPGPAGDNQGVLELKNTSGTSYVYRSPDGHFRISSGIIQLDIDSSHNVSVPNGGIFVGPGIDNQSSPTNSRIKTNLNENVLTIENSYSAGNYGSTALKISVADTQTSGGDNTGAANNRDNWWHFIRAFANKTSEQFAVTGDGRTWSQNYQSLNADYAELFEWEDGNILSEDRRGYTVSLVGTKIKICSVDEDPIGVISSAPSFVADTAWNEWAGKYLKDEFGSRIIESYTVYQWEQDGTTHTYETTSVPDGVIVPENCEVLTRTRDTINPQYDPAVRYVPRGERKEWSPVGLVGKLRVRKGQVVGSRWIKLRDISDTVEEWLVR